MRNLLILISSEFITLPLAIKHFNSSALSNKLIKPDLKLNICKVRVKQMISDNMATCGSDSTSVSWQCIAFKLLAWSSDIVDIFTDKTPTQTLAFVSRGKGAFKKVESFSLAEQKIN